MAGKWSLWLKKYEEFPDHTSCVPPVNYLPFRVLDISCLIISRIHTYYNSEFSASVVSEHIDFAIFLQFNKGINFLLMQHAENVCIFGCMCSSTKVEFSLLRVNYDWRGLQPEWTNEQTNE